MNDLLSFAVEAHGGLERWNEFSRLRAEVSIGGAIWDFKKQPGLFRNKVFEIDTHVERLTITPFLRDDQRSLFVPGKLTIETLAGDTRDFRDDPEVGFIGQAFADPWDPLQAAFFASEALWTYLTSPFLYTYPGFHTEEIAPWYENGEEWRRLKVTFPDEIVSHTKTQITHFGPDGLMRRHDYTVDILNGNSGANYPFDYREFQGIQMPTKRRIYAYDETLRKVPEPLLVALDFGAIAFS